jgi:hypothetical protein
MPGRGVSRSLQDWLYVLIVGSLALYAVIGVIAWTWMIIRPDVETPPAFATVMAAVIGALAGIVAPLSSPSSRERSDT